MSPSAKKQFNTAIGAMFLGLGIIAWGVAVVFALKPSDQRRLPPVVLAPTVDLNTCRSSLNSLYGFVTRTSANGDLVVTTQDIADPQKALNDATAAIGLCKRELVEFCMGTGCAEPGMTMTLALSEEQKKVPKELAKPAAAASAAGANKQTVTSKK